MPLSARTSAFGVISRGARLQPKPLQLIGRGNDALDRMQALQRLIASGAKVQRKSETGSSALQCAAESGSFPVFSHLLQACFLSDIPHP